jgi:hypothetical protein
VFGADVSATPSEFFKKVCFHKYKGESNLNNEYPQLDEKGI